MRAVALGGDRVGKNKKSAFIAARLVEPLQKQIKFQIKHRLQTLAADVTFGLAVNRVTHRHVVGRNSLGDSARRLADVKKPARHFLPRADFGERAVFFRVQIDVERLLVRIELFFVHTRTFQVMVIRRRARSWQGHAAARP